MDHRLVGILSPPLHPPFGTVHGVNSPDAEQCTATTVLTGSGKSGCKYRGAVPRVVLENHYEADTTGLPRYFPLAPTFQGNGAKSAKE
jgi:hypothetical protein